jgi:AcrR family transcriptional regulator
MHCQASRGPHPSNDASFSAVELECVEGEGRSPVKLPNVTVAGTRVGRPPRLNRDDVVAAAERLVERSGIGALTMRGVASELGISPMALYRHVRNKDDLLVMLLDRLVERLPKPSLPAQPRQRALLLLRIIYDGLAQSPWVVGILAKGDLMAPAALWYVERTVAALVAAGLSTEQAGAAYRTAWRYTVGDITIRFASAQRSRTLRREPIQHQVYGGPDPGQYPTLARLSNYWVRAGAADTYDEGVAAIVDGFLADG